MAESLRLMYLDPGPVGWKVPPNTLTARESGCMRGELLSLLPGRKGEHALFALSPTGRKSRATWQRFVSSIRSSGIKEPVSIHVERDGSAWIQEGNHRIRAAIEARRLVPVEISYFGNSQKKGWLFPQIARI